MKPAPNARPPRTVALLQHTGIGDVVWLIQYLKLLAQASQGGRLTIVAQPSSRARDLIGQEPWVEAVIDHDHRPRRGEKRKGRHAGLRGMRAIAAELRAGGFDRIVLFSGRPSRGLIAWMSGIPVRQGYGYRLLQRMFLTSGPYIPAHRGHAPPVHHEASAFMVAHGYCDRPIVPRMDPPEREIPRMRQRLAALPRPLYVLAIGTSEVHKQWGAPGFAQVAAGLVRDGAGVVLLGGPAEAAMAREIVAGIPHAGSAVEVITDASVLGSVAALQLADACLGNDTGMVSVAAALGRPTYVLTGPRPLLDHDPEHLYNITAAHLADISADEVLSLLRGAALPRRQTA